MKPTISTGWFLGTAFSSTTLDFLTEELWLFLTDLFCTLPLPLTSLPASSWVNSLLLGESWAWPNKNRCSVFQRPTWFCCIPYILQFRSSFRTHVCINMSLLFQSLEEIDFFKGSPRIFQNRELQLVHHLIVRWPLLQLCEAGHTIQGGPWKDECEAACIPFANWTFILLSWIQDALI